MLQLIIEPLDSLIQETSDFKTQAVIFPFIQQIGIELHIMCQLLFQGLGNQPGEDRNYITLGFTTVFTSPFITSPLGGRYNQFCVAGKEQRAQENSRPAQGLKASK